MKKNTDERVNSHGKLLSPMKKSLQKNDVPRFLFQRLSRRRTCFRASEQTIEEKYRAISVERMDARSSGTTKLHGSRNSSRCITFSIYLLQTVIILVHRDVEKGHDFSGGVGGRGLGAGKHERVARGACRPCFLHLRRR